MSIMVNAVSLKSFYIFVNQIPWFPEFCWSACDYALLKFILCSVGRQISLYGIGYTLWTITETLDRNKKK